MYTYISSHHAHIDTCSFTCLKSYLTVQFKCMYFILLIHQWLQTKKPISEKCLLQWHCLSSKLHCCVPFEIIRTLTCLCSSQLNHAIWIPNKLQWDTVKFSLEVVDCQPPTGDKQRWINLCETSCFVNKQWDFLVDGLADLLRCLVAFYFSDMSVFAIMVILVRTNVHTEVATLIRNEAT